MLVSELPVSHGRGVVERAQERLLAVPYLSFSDVRCEYRRGRLILHGRVESYYEKQLAQEAVARLQGVARVVNQIEVAWADSSLLGRAVR
jgi:osmotically-inducible protein OsmY